MGEYSMRSYFQQMPTVGKPLVAPNAENEELLRAVEEEILFLKHNLQVVPMNL